MLIKLENPSGQMEKVRIENLQYYLNHGYKRIIESVQEPETVELMSPAGKAVVLKKDMHDYLQREGWSLLEPETSAEDETPELPVEDETPETSVEDEIPALPTDEVPVEEPELVTEPESESESVEAETESVNEEAEEAQLEE